ncbi:MFS transporter [Acidiphilium iwatense]|uniref:MFS transporter n=1 Tax=Acidiphilium iwatense TaxID=768198 RepID=UPI001F3291E4|nr:MFS transporter [Acidiphilium iwatense]
MTSKIVGVMDQKTSINWRLNVAAPEDMQSTAVSPETIIARIDRLPVTRWHVIVRIIIGSATFFDAFSVLSIAYVVPALIGLWHIDAKDIGLLFAGGFLGQAIGAITCGWLAERVGRVPMLRASVLLFAIMSILCALSHSYDQLLAARVLQGFGLGAEVPIAATYIGEISSTKNRGRFFLLYETIYPIGLFAVGLVAAWLVPNVGWRWLFAFGVVPAFLVFAMQKYCPESPRWLASKGRLAEADAMLRKIENYVSSYQQLAPISTLSVAPIPTVRSRVSELFGPGYRKRTFVVWGLWLLSFFVTFGIAVWMPSILHTVYHLPLEKSIQLSLIGTLSGLLGCFVMALSVDKIGRVPLFVFGFSLSGVSLLGLSIYHHVPLDIFVMTTAVAYFGANITSVGLYLYTAEIYPTRLRAIGTSVGTTWLRLGSIASPYLVGLVLPLYGISGVLLMFGVVAVAGAILARSGMIETKQRRLEEISP